jgi:hypothetical protein
MAKSKEMGASRKELKAKSKQRRDDNKSKDKPMRRKLFGLTLSAMLFALCLPAHAQQPAKIPRIGFLLAVSPSAAAARTEVFRQGLRELGYVEGKNIAIESRYAEGNLDRSRRSRPNSCVSR